ncbi:MAG: DNA-deoxyinosine glycosylase [Lachnospiraceae bacterium]|nr:DNA-deoxyinosine glycosylase [Lachnospiraceae bacterium]
MNTNTAVVEHTFEPVYDSSSRLLILGTFPSVKSRENGFYYGHPQNRFWKVISQITQEDLPDTIEKKKALLLRQGIAIWDVIHSCRITGSSDSSIRDVVANDIGGLLKNTSITHIFGNGDKACRLYEKYCQEQTGKPIIRLPSTSPANAAFSLARLIECWGRILEEE